MEERTCVKTGRKKSAAAKWTVLFLCIFFAFFLAVLFDNGKLLLSGAKPGSMPIEEALRDGPVYAEQIAYELSGEILFYEKEGEAPVSLPPGSRALTLCEQISFTNGETLRYDRTPAYLTTQYAAAGGMLSGFSVRAVSGEGYNDSASNEQIAGAAFPENGYPYYDFSNVHAVNVRVVNELSINPYLCWFACVLAGSAAALLLFRPFFAGRVHLAFLLLCLAFGSSIVLSLPRSKVGYDEEAHLQAVMDMASMPDGMNVSDPVVNQLMVTEYNNPNHQPSGAEEMTLFDAYLRENGNYKTGENAPDFYTMPNRMPAYAAMALFVKLGKGLSLSWPLLLLCGRFANLLLYAALMCTAIKKAPVGKCILTAIALFPENLFLASTFSYDPFVTGCLTLGAVCFLEELFRKEGEALSLSNTVLMFAMTVIGCLPKAVYAPMILFALCLPKERFRKKSGYRIFLCVTVLLFLLLLAGFILPTVFAPAPTGDVRGGATSEVSQVGFILANPLRYAALLLRQMVLWIPQCFFGADCITFMGHLVNGYTPFRGYWYFYLPFLLCLILAEPGKDGAEFRFSEGFWMFLMTGASCVLIWTSMYVAFTEPGASEIAGVQGRYFIPFLYPLYLLCNTAVRRGRSCLGGRNLAGAEDLCYHGTIGISFLLLAFTVYRTVLAAFCM